MKRATIETYLTRTVAEIVFLRDNYTCQRCNKDVKDRDCQPAHIISKSAGGFNLRWYLLDIIALCNDCHNVKGHAQGDMKRWFKEKYPARWRLIQDERAKPTKTWKDDDLLELLNQRRQKLAEMKGAAE